MKKVSIYTDGACSGNPGPGGYGVILECDGVEKELSGGEGFTTNNRMELTAVLVGLETLKYPCDVTIYSDSSYIVDAVNKGWLRSWKQRDWIKPDRQPVKNPDLWEKLLVLMNGHTVRFVWVKGHAANPKNNRCDELAVAASQRYK